MADHTIKMFLKFGQKEHIKELFESGTIYMNSIQYFRKIEDGELRGDVYEGVSRIKNLPPGQFFIPELNHLGNYLSLHLRQSYETVLGNIFSLYCISSHGCANPKDFKIDTKINRFGSHCLFIKDNTKFISLLENKLQELKMKYRLGFVEYYDKEQVNRDINLFEKPLEFEYQKEFRIYIERFSDKPFAFSIGSLSDIAEMHESIGVIETMKLQPLNEIF